MSKKYKDKPCAYCPGGISVDGDHVFARQFVPVAQRANLPKVPSCKACNLDKADLEHYLTALLPFGARHPDALMTLETMVPGRLKKNTKLQCALSDGRETIMTEEAPGQFVSTMALPFEEEKFERWVGYLVRGLYWHHFAQKLPDDHGVVLIASAAWAVEKLGRFLELGGQRISNNLANGALIYEAAKGDDVSVWRLRLLGGLKVTGDVGGATEESADWFAITGRREFIARLGWGDTR